MPSWWEDDNKVAALADWLCEIEWFTTPQAVVDYFKTAYKYEHEWQHFIGCGEAAKRGIVDKLPIWANRHPPRQKRCELCATYNPEADDE